MGNRLEVDGRFEFGRFDRKRWKTPIFAQKTHMRISQFVGPELVQCTGLYPTNHQSIITQPMAPLGSHRSHRPQVCVTSPTSNPWRGTPPRTPSATPWRTPRCNHRCRRRCRGPRRRRSRPWRWRRCRD